MKSPAVAVLSCLIVSLAPATLRSADDGLVLRSVLPPGIGLTALRRAVMGARLRLERSTCQRLFTELSDLSGRPLQEGLDALGQTAAGYLGLVMFADGSDLPHCRARRALAFTSPGSRVVYVCPARLSHAVDQNAAKAEATVIHEMLHSLGLGENPPSPEEITARVLARCH